MSPAGLKPGAFFGRGVRDRSRPKIVYLNYFKNMDIKFVNLAKAVLCSSPNQRKF